MKLTNHVNFVDSEGQIYCCLRNKLVKLDQQQEERFCNGCQMFAGFANGGGVECMWEDARHVNNPHIIVDPFQEFISNQRRVVPSENMSSMAFLAAEAG
ncbi:hypothetical protein [Paenibacillus agricola]|uniref:Uncharacterized protein n=1 Tax=Paenibacillus agricola TaxID=2716264 RepID=A0ABX0J9G7_9BACL|nr:hypothetical protein [Paenibacillus agricola]NHN33014.1 hypothetical protein [Paenibacillus agricola]